MFRAHHRMVFLAAYRITGNAADAEDVLQTVFLRMVRRDPALRALENPESYLRRAAVNAGLDIVRSRQDAGTVPLEDLPSSVACTELHDLRDGLRRALAKLAPRPAEIFALRFFEGYTNPEIARMLGTSQTSVAVTLHRARRQLQKEMEAQDLRPNTGVRS